MFRLRSINVLSCAKIFAVLQGAIGILVGFFLVILALVSVAVPGHQKFKGAMVFIVAAVFSPVIYALLGFVMGAIWAFVYNLAAQSFGGIEVHLDVIPPISGT